MLTLQPLLKLQQPPTFGNDNFAKRLESFRNWAGHTVVISIVNHSGGVKIQIADLHGDRLGELEFSSAGAAYMAGILYAKAIEADQTPPPAPPAEGGAT